MTKKMEEYQSLRQEILESQKTANTNVLATATMSASLFIVATQIDDSAARGFAFFMPQIIAAIFLSQMRRRNRLIHRLASYIAVFYDLPDGGWELYSRYPFPDSEADTHKLHCHKWRIPKGLYTTYGFLLAVVCASSGLLLTIEPFWPWGLLGLLAPALSIGFHLYENRGYRKQTLNFLTSWHMLKKKEENESPQTIFEEIVKVK